MIRLTLAQMRLSLGRLIPAGLAIMLGTAFVAFTLIAGNVMTRSAYDQMTAQFGAADLVVTGSSGVGAQDLARVQSTAGVTHADPIATAWVQLGSGSRGTTQIVIPTTSDPQLSPLVVSVGREPAGPDQIALPAETAERLNVAVGDRIQVAWTPADASEPVARSVRVVGLVDDPKGAWTMWGRAALVDLPTLALWSGADELTYDAVLVTSDDPGATSAALTEALGDGLRVQTRDAIAAEKVAEQTGDTNMLVTVVLGFAAIALLVAALVIANTFQVLIAQRTRTLALLRCVGARRRQLRAAVVLEGALLGLVASFAGLAVGVGVSQGVLVALDHVRMGVPIPDVVPLSVWVVVLPLLIGTAVTVAACLVPARAASAVAPVAALRPADAPSARRGAGRARLAAALTLGVGGTALLVVATVAAVRSGDFAQAQVWLGVGVLGAGLSFVGMLVGGVFWMPRVVAGFGALAGRLGPAAELAAANARRNPRRTAATSAALLIGVTLVATMSTGAATARSSLDALLDEQFAVDLTASSIAAGEGGQPEGVTALDGSALPAIAEVAGVAAAVPVLGTTAVTQSERSVTVYAVTPQQALEVLRDRSAADALATGHAVTPESLSTDDELTLASGARTVRLQTAGGWSDGGSVLIPLAAAQSLDPRAAVVSVWAKLAPGADPTQVLAEVQDALGSQPVMVGSGAAERAQYQRVIDVMLAVVIGLLAVAVVIAIIGVANTLSLSVLERRRESATLRSVGMTRRQLRGSLALEGVLVALVGTGAGIVLGLLYGWAGSLIVFGPLEGTRLSVPWADLVVVVAVAIAAGFLASVLPARSAVRTSPVAALAVE